MLSHLRIPQYITSIFVLTLLFAGCGSNTPTKRHKVTPKKTGESDILSRWTDSYLENKKIVAEQKALKQRMREELPTTNLKELNYDQLAIARKYFDELGHHERAGKCYERMLTLTKDPMQLNTLRLELADRYFEAGNFEKASKLYLGFLEFYPGSDKREYVEYKAILAHFYITLSNDRDQTETKTTLALTQDFLAHESIYKNYAQDVKDIQKQCYEKLAGSEMSICAFHLRHGNPKGAEQRLAFLNKHYRRHVPTLEPEILALETNLNTELGIQMPDMPGFKQDSVILAQNTENGSGKRPMVDRF